MTTTHRAIASGDRVTATPQHLHIPHLEAMEMAGDQTAARQDSKGMSPRILAVVLHQVNFHLHPWAMRGPAQ